MSTTTVLPPSILQWKPYAEQASHAYGVPVPVLLALIDEESGGNPGETSPTGAKGITQFEPSTAAIYHVNTEPGGEYSQVMGAAHYLHDLGYTTNPEKALAAYNAGPGDWQAGISYAETVLAKAREYGASNLNGTPGAPAETIPTAENPLIPAGRGTGNALKYLAYILLFTIGAYFAYTGLKHTTTGEHQ